jgi:type I restriction enzyme R subunit
MSPHAYSEDQLVEQPAIGLFAALGWQTVSALDETFGAGGTLGRETRGEVVLVERLRAALGKFNPTLPPEAIANAVDELTRDRSAMSLEAANREVYRLLKEGITVSVPEREHGGKSGGQCTERLRVVDWEHPENNDFLLVSQLTVTGPLYTCRPDLVGFVNGLPWVVIELKKPGVPARAAFDENLTHYRQQIPALFWSNALLIASNGTDSRVGSLTADWGRFFDWKRIEREDEPRRVSLEVILRGTCDKSRLLDLVRNFTLFSEHKSGLVKVLGQNHQFLGVNNAIALDAGRAQAAATARPACSGRRRARARAFRWSSTRRRCFARWPGNWTFVVVTDRVELDEQIARTFKTTGAVSEAAGDECHAASGAHLRELLRGNHRYVFTLVHKFQTPELLCERSDVIVLTDEAHRSQYDTLALNMRAALPRAMFLAFTGTPLIAGEERTKEVFGDYVSIYDFQQSIEDGATVPLFYENRTPELQLVNPDLNEDIYRLIEDAELDADQEANWRRCWGGNTT